MNGCCTTDFQKKVSEFISSATCMVAKDNNNKRAIIVIAVEENEKGDNANTQVLAAGTEEKLVYAKPNLQLETNQEVCLIGLLSF